MIRYERPYRLFAMALAALAGFVDATAFVLTGGLFVSFMSGNSTRLAVAGVNGSSIALLAGGLIVLFLVGVITSALIAASRPATRKSRVMLLSTLAVLAAAISGSLQARVPTAMMLAMGMGALNNVFLREGEVSIGVTYMTGALVRTGQRIAAALLGKEPSDWMPYLLLWVSLVLGAGLGAALAIYSATTALWLASCLSAFMTLIVIRLEGARTLGNGHEEP